MIQHSHPPLLWDGRSNSTSPEVEAFLIISVSKSGIMNLIGV